MFVHMRDMESRPIRISREYAVGEIDFFDKVLRQTSPLKVEGQAELKQVLDEIRVKGHLTVELELDCDRCLAPLKWPVSTAFDLLYAPADRVTAPEEANLNDEEANLGFYQGAGLELVDVLREQVLLVLPMQRTCREICPGVCPGQTENLIDLEGAPLQVMTDPRWSTLQGLKLKK